MNVIRHAILLVTMCFALASCSSPEAKRAEYAKEYVTARNDMSAEFRMAILQGRVVLGMSPEEAIAAAAEGNYSILIIDKDPAWPRDTSPQEVIDAQHSSPDSSLFRLDFMNHTQFASKEPTIFSVCFAKGKAFLITRDEANMCGSDKLTK